MAVQPRDPKKAQTEPEKKKAETVLLSAEELQRLSHLAHVHGVPVLLREGIHELGRGLALERDQAQGDPGGAGAPRDQLGVDALPRDQREGKLGIELLREVR